MQITDETKRLSYIDILEVLGKRQIEVLEYLEKYQMEEGLTANELSYKMWQEKIFLTHDRNNVHPRLNELVEKKLVDIIGKRKCTISKRMCAVYKIALS
jgi:hypothetical protein